MSDSELHDVLKAELEPKFQSYFNQGLMTGWDACIYEVLYVGDHLDSSINKNVRVALIRHKTTDTEFVVRLEKLELVS